jgi:hypothetical protein
LCLQFIGSTDIGDYRGNSVITDTIAQIRRAKTKPQKVVISIKFKGVTVTEEKSKVYHWLADKEGGEHECMGVTAFSI